MPRKKAKAAAPSDGDSSDASDEQPPSKPAPRRKSAGAASSAAPEAKPAPRRKSVSSAAAAAAPAPPPASSLHAFFGAPRSGPPPSAAPIRVPTPVYIDPPLASYNPAFLQPVGGLLPCLRYALRLQACHHATATPAPPPPLPPPPPPPPPPQPPAPCTPLSTLPLLAAAHASRLSIYPLHLAHLLRTTVLANPATAHLFSPAEAALARRVLALPPRAALLLSRITARKGPWLKADSFARYGELSSASGYGEPVAAAAADAAAAAAPAAQQPANDAPAEEEEEEAAPAAASAAPKPKGAPASMPWEALGTSSALLAARAAAPPGPARPAPCRLRPSADDIQAALAVLAASGLATCFPAPPAAAPLQQAAPPPPAPRGRAAPLPPSLLQALQAVTACATLEQARQLALALGIRVTPAPRQQAAGAAGGAAAAAAAAPAASAPPPRPPSAFTAITLHASAAPAAAPAALTRGDYLRCIEAAVRSQRTVQGLPLPLESAAERVLRGSSGSGSSGSGGGGGSSSSSSSSSSSLTGSLTSASTSASGRALLVRAVPELLVLLRRVHGLFYLVSSTSSLTSGQGTGTWPEGMGEAEGEGGDAAVAEGEEGGAWWLAQAPHEHDDDEVVVLGEEGGEEEEEEVVVVVEEAGASGSSAAPPPPPPPPPPHFPPPPPPAFKPAHSHKAPSGSKYGDLAPSREALARTLHGSGGASALDAIGGGLRAPAMLQLFRMVDFAPLPAATPPPPPAFATRAALRQWEAAQLFRSQVDATGVLGVVPPAELLAVPGEGEGGGGGGGGGGGEGGASGSAGGSASAASASAAAAAAAQPATGKRASPSPEHFSGAGLVRCLEFPWEAEPPASSAAASAADAPHARMGVHHMLSMAPGVPPALAGLSLLPFAALLVGAPPPPRGQPPPRTLLAAAAASTRAACAAAPAHSAAAGAGAGSLRAVLRASGSAALAALGASIGAALPCAPDYARACAALAAALPAAPALAVAYRSSLALACCMAAEAEGAAGSAAGAAGGASGGPADASTSAGSAAAAGAAAAGASSSAAADAASSAVTDAAPSDLAAPPPPPPHPATPLLPLHPACLYATLLWEAQDALERARGYAHTLPFLLQLVGAPYTPHRAGRWWLRLCLNLRHLGLARDEQAVVQEALRRGSVVLGERLALEARRRAVAGGGGEGEGEEAGGGGVRGGRRRAAGSGKRRAVEGKGADAAGAGAAAAGAAAASASASAAAAECIDVDAEEEEEEAAAGEEDEEAMDEEEGEAPGAPGAAGAAEDEAAEAGSEEGWASCTRGLRIALSPAVTLPAMPLLAALRAQCGGRPQPLASPSGPAPQRRFIPVHTFARAALGGGKGGGARGKSRYLPELEGEEGEEEEEEEGRGEGEWEACALGGGSARSASPAHLAATDAVCAAFGVAWPRGAWDFTYSAGAGASSAPAASRTPSALSVEDVALAWYAEPAQGGWRGWHCEGAPLYALFALLLWEQLFGSEAAPPPRGAFLTPFQDAPMDLDGGGHAFYGARHGALQGALRAIAASDAPALAARLAAAWGAHHGQACRGLHWGAAPLGLLQLLAVGLGGPTLAALCDALAFNYRALHSGLPDLVLWKAGGVGGAPRVRLVEVKGPSDSLRDGQLAWLHILAEAGVDVAVCKVTAGGGSAAAGGV